MSSSQTYISTSIHGESHSGLSVLILPEDPTSLYMCRWYAAAPNPSDDQEEERQVGNPRINQLVDEICSMNLLEVSDLIEVLRKRLNITMPVGGGYPMGGKWSTTVFLPCLSFWLRCIAASAALQHSSPAN